MLILSEAEVRQCFPVSAAIACNRKALSSLRKDGNGGAVVPTRIGLPYNPGDPFSTPSTDWSLFKPAAYYPSKEKEQKKDDVIMGMKVVSVRANNPSIGKPLVPATIMLLNPETGEVSSIMGATYLTAARTAAGSALATELAFCNLPSNEDLTLVVFGAGLQAELHIRSIQHVVKVRNIIIVNRTLDRAKKLKDVLQSDKNAQPSSISTVMLSEEETVQHAVKNADIIVTATNTCIPLFDGKLVKPGCHINGVGSVSLTSYQP
jgi:ornithine cyclodeaminase